MVNLDCAIIAAAGLGSRLNQNIPKALVNITEDKKIIDFQMEMLENINDIRVVVGYKCNKLSSYIKENYGDVKVIYNQDYKYNSICYSVYLASKELDEPYIVMCSDLIIDKIEFEKFIDSFNNESLLGITPVKSEECIYASLNNGKITSFQRKYETPYEWANIACINESVNINKNGMSFYSQLRKYLPLKYFLFENCFEVDTSNDLKFVLDNLYKIL